MACTNNSMALRYYANMQTRVNIDYKKQWSSSPLVKKGYNRPITKWRLVQDFLLAAASSRTLRLAERRGIWKPDSHYKNDGMLGICRMSLRVNNWGLCVCAIARDNLLDLSCGHNTVYVMTKEEIARSISVNRTLRISQHTSCNSHGGL